MADLRRAIPVTAPINSRAPGLHIEHAGGVLRIVFAWRSTGSVLLTVVGVCCGSIGICLMASMGTGPIIAGSLVAGLGLVVGWAGVAGLLNRTTLEASKRELTSRHGPVPWQARVTIPAGEILQLYVDGRDLGRSFGSLNRVRAALEDGSHPALTWYIPASRYGWAEHIEREIERHLKIVNRPVLCPQCQYDLRATYRRCPECGLVLRTNKRTRRAWAEAVTALMRKKRR